jgi:hypothetical protein
MRRERLAWLGVEFMDTARNIVMPIVTDVTRESNIKFP